MATAIKGVTEAVIRPKVKHILRMHPYLPIPPNEDGSGGGIILRVYGEAYEPTYLRVVWGESAQIEVVVA